MLVQDYHFALLPRMIRERLPRATIITFWHIPWPNPEAFAICPWRDELLDGLLGSSILGFHTQFHCNNFLDTVDRLLEARVDRETFDVVVPRRGARRCTAIRSRSSGRRRALATRSAGRRGARSACASASACRAATRSASASTASTTRRASWSASARSSACSSSQPQWIGRFTFVQIAAPSRGDDRATTATTRERVRALADEINARFADARHPPIMLLAEHHEPDAVYEYYRAADLCFVSSLHDGMNLVAKEFVAARDDEQGVLVLSQFTGASRELPEALIVNPYDAEQCAAALHVALTMPRRRAARADAADARHRARVQRLPLGRPHAARRRRDAPARNASIARPRRSWPDAA